MSDHRKAQTNPSSSPRPDVKVVCRVKADFSDIPVGQFKRLKNRKTGKDYFEVDVELQARFQGGDLTWRMMWKGKEWGSTTVSYDD